MQRKRRFVPLVLYSPMIVSLLVIGACAETGYRTMSPEEALKETTRFYRGIDTQKVLDASQRILNLFDGKSFELSRSGSEVFGVRRFPNLPLTSDRRRYTDTWKIVAEEKNDGTSVTVSVERKSPRILGDRYERRPLGPAPYFIFWKRMDYLLGQSKQWFTCHDAHLAIDKGDTWGSTVWLCEFTRDELPPELRRG